MAASGRLRDGSQAKVRLGRTKHGRVKPLANGSSRAGVRRRILCYEMSSSSDAARMCDLITLRLQILTIFFLLLSLLHDRVWLIAIAEELAFAPTRKLHTADHLS